MACGGDCGCSDCGGAQAPARRRGPGVARGDGGCSDCGGRSASSTHDAAHVAHRGEPVTPPWVEGADRRGRSTGGIVAPEGALSDVAAVHPPQALEARAGGDPPDPFQRIRPRYEAAPAATAKSIDRRAGATVDAEAVSEAQAPTTGRRSDAFAKTLPHELLIETGRGKGGGREGPKGIRFKKPSGEIPGGSEPYTFSVARIEPDPDRRDLWPFPPLDEPRRDVALSPEGGSPTFFASMAADPRAGAAIELAPGTTPAAAVADSGAVASIAECECDCVEIPSTRWDVAIGPGFTTAGANFVQPPLFFATGSKRTTTDVSRIAVAGSISSGVRRVDGQALDSGSAGGRRAASPAGAVSRQLLGTGGAPLLASVSIVGAGSPPASSLSASSQLATSVSEGADEPRLATFDRMRRKALGLDSDGGTPTLPLTGGGVAPVEGGSGRLVFPSPVGGGSGESGAGTASKAKQGPDGGAAPVAGGAVPPGGGASPAGGGGEAGRSRKPGEDGNGDKDNEPDDGDDDGGGGGGGGGKGTPVEPFEVLRPTPSTTSAPPVAYRPPVAPPLHPVGSLPGGRGGEIHAPDGGAGGRFGIGPAGVPGYGARAAAALGRRTHAPFGDLGRFDVDGRPLRGASGDEGGLGGASRRAQADGRSRLTSAGSNATAQRYDRMALGPPATGGGFSVRDSLVNSDLVTVKAGKREPEAAWKPEAIAERAGRADESRALVAPPDSSGRGEAASAGVRSVARPGGAGAAVLAPPGVLRVEGARVLAPPRGASRRGAASAAVRSPTAGPTASDLRSSFAPVERRPVTSSEPEAFGHPASAEDVGGGTGTAARSPSGRTVLGPAMTSKASLAAQGGGGARGGGGGGGGASVGQAASLMDYAERMFGAGTEAASRAGEARETLADATARADAALGRVRRYNDLTKRVEDATKGLGPALTPEQVEERNELAKTFKADSSASPEFAAVAWGAAGDVATFEATREAYLDAAERAQADAQAQIQALRSAGHSQAERRVNEEIVRLRSDGAQYQSRRNALTSDQNLARANERVERRNDQTVAASRGGPVGRATALASQAASESASRTARLRSLDELDARQTQLADSARTPLERKELSKLRADAPRRSKERIRELTREVKQLQGLAKALPKAIAALRRSNDPEKLERANELEATLRALSAADGPIAKAQEKLSDATKPTPKAKSVPKPGKSGSGTKPSPGSNAPALGETPEGSPAGDPLDGVEPAKQAEWDAAEQDRKKRQEDARAAKEAREDEDEKRRLLDGAKATLEAERVSMPTAWTFHVALISPDGTASSAWCADPYVVGNRVDAVTDGQGFSVVRSSVAVAPPEVTTLGGLPCPDSASYCAQMICPPGTTCECKTVPGVVKPPGTGGGAGGNGPTVDPKPGDTGGGGGGGPGEGGGGGGGDPRTGARQGGSPPLCPEGSVCPPRPMTRGRAPAGIDPHLYANVRLPYFEIDYGTRPIPVPPPADEEVSGLPCRPGVRFWLPVRSIRRATIVRWGDGFALVVGERIYRIERAVGEVEGAGFGVLARAGLRQTNPLPIDLTRFEFEVECVADGIYTGLRAILASIGFGGGAFAKVWADSPIGKSILNDPTAAVLAKLLRGEEISDDEILDAVIATFSNLVAGKVVKAGLKILKHLLAALAGIAKLGAKRLDALKRKLEAVYLELNPRAKRRYPGDSVGDTVASLPEGTSLPVPDPPRRPTPPRPKEPPSGRSASSESPGGVEPEGSRPTAQRGSTRTSDSASGDGPEGGAGSGRRGDGAHSEPGSTPGDRAPAGGDLRKRPGGTGRQTGGRAGEYSSADDAWAAKRYDEIRSDPGDVDRIAGATGLRPENIQKVKKHVFEDVHVKDKFVDQGVPPEVGRFDPDPEQVRIWERLQSGRHTQDDIAWLKHEVAERKHMELSGSRSYGSAHDTVKGRWPSPLEK